MLRGHLMRKRAGEAEANAFRWRGTDVTRLEGFSDAVLGFAVTLLVVSLDVPNTFDELLRTLRGFVPFGLCFAYLVFLWYEHYLYFRRYGLQTIFVLYCNTVLMFVILMYVYPLKFLASYMLDGLVGLNTPWQIDDGLSKPIVAADQLGLLMIVYGVGFIAVRLTFLVMYAYAYRHRDQLALSPVERFDTRTSIQGHVINVCVGCVSVAIAAWGGPNAAGLAGWTYISLIPLLVILGAVKRRRRPLFADHETLPAALNS